ncbi:acidic proline-rich protein PRP25-like, partial [Chamaea fasciata]|uniref:acidic proline-rich protein PRP25-like n=1 Tax=Chamaea fasciata TaxID=190680 RepID=UPI00336AB9E4
VPSAPPVPGPRKLACLGALLLLTFHLAPLSLPQPGPAPRAPAPPPRGRRAPAGGDGSGRPSPPRDLGPLPPPRGPLQELVPVPRVPLGRPREPRVPRLQQDRVPQAGGRAPGVGPEAPNPPRDPRGAPPEPPPAGRSRAPPPWKGPGGARLIPAVPTRPERAPPGQLQLYQGPRPPRPPNPGRHRPPGRHPSTSSPSAGTTCCSRPAATTKPPGPKCPW